MGCLFNYRTEAVWENQREIRRRMLRLCEICLPFWLVPPVFLEYRLIRASITSNCGHDSQIILLNCALHHLHGAQVTQHITSGWKVWQHDTWTIITNNVPDWTNRVRGINSFGHGERISDIFFNTCCYRFLNKYGNTRKVLDNLQFDVAIGFGCAAVEGGTANDDGPIIMKLSMTCGKLRMLNTEGRPREWQHQRILEES